MPVTAESVARWNVTLAVIPLGFSYHRYARQSISDMPSSAPSTRRLRVKATKPIRDYWTRPLMRLLDCSSVNYFKLTSYVYSSRRPGRPKYLSPYRTRGSCTAPYTIENFITESVTPYRSNLDQNLAKHYLLCHESTDVMDRDISRGVSSRDISWDLYKCRR